MLHVNKNACKTLSHNVILYLKAHTHVSGGVFKNISVSISCVLHSRCLQSFTYELFLYFEKRVPDVKHV